MAPELELDDELLDEDDDEDEELLDDEELLAGGSPLPPHPANVSVAMVKSGARVRSGKLEFFIVQTPKACAEACAIINAVFYIRCCLVIVIIFVFAKPAAPPNFDVIKNACVNHAPSFNTLALLTFNTEDPILFLTSN